MKIVKMIAMFLLLGGASAGADPTRASVERLLGGYEPRFTAEDLRRLGPGVDRVLITIATDERASSTLHRRALASLGYVPSAAGLELLRATIHRHREAHEGLDGLDVEVCARTLPRFGAPVLRDLVGLLIHPAVDARRLAAAGLAELGLPEGRAPLQLRLAAERDPDVQAALVRALALLDAHR